MGSLRAQLDIPHLPDHDRVQFGEADAVMGTTPSQVRDRCVSSSMNRLHEAGCMPCCKLCTPPTCQTLTARTLCP